MGVASPSILITVVFCKWSSDNRHPKIPASSPSPAVIEASGQGCLKKIQVVASIQGSTVMQYRLYRA